MTTAITSHAVLDEARDIAVDCARAAYGTLAFVTSRHRYGWVSVDEIPYPDGLRPRPVFLFGLAVLSSEEMGEKLAVVPPLSPAPEDTFGSDESTFYAKAHYLAKQAWRRVFIGGGTGLFDYQAEALALAADCDWRAVSGWCWSVESDLADDWHRETRPRLEGVIGGGGFGGEWSEDDHEAIAGLYDQHVVGPWPAIAKGIVQLPEWDCVRLVTLIRQEHAQACRERGGVGCEGEKAGPTQS